MAEFRKLPTQAELQNMLFMEQMRVKTPQQIAQEALASGTTVTPIPENVFQKIAGGAGIAKEYVNRAGSAADLAKLFPGYKPETKVNIPTGYNFAPKQAPTGEVIPGGLQTQNVNLGQVLGAIKPADVLGISGAERAYSDIGAGKAPQPLDVLDVASVGYLPAKAAMTGARVGKAVLSGVRTGMDSALPSFGKGLKDAKNYQISEEGGFYNVTPRQLAEGGDAFKQTQGFGVYPGTASEARGRGRAIYGVDEQEANRQVSARLSDPSQNPLFNIANTYSQNVLGKPYQFDLKMPESSLAKQSGIGRSYELLADGSKTQKDAVFNAYVNDPEYSQIIQQYNIKDYDDLVAKSYQQLEKETIDQFRKLPLRLQFHTGQGNYLDSPEAIRDMILHGNLTVYKGGDRHDFLHKVDKETGLNSNEMFRAVHDAFGHGIRGNSFGALGEEVAWGSHAQMYSPLARIAMTSETRGQNSFVNYTPINASLVRKMEDLRAVQYEAQRRGDTGLANEIAGTLRELGNDWQYAKQAALALPPEFTRLDFAGGMPEYLRTSQQVPMPVAPSELTHFGKVGGLLELDPTKYGSGIAGQEAARLKYTKNPVVDRTYFYRGTPETVTPEVGLGRNVYTAQVPNLYDITADPLMLANLADIRNRTSYLSRYGQGRFDQPQYLTDLERLTKEYGYSGLLDPTKAVVWNPTAVRQVK